MSGAWRTSSTLKPSGTRGSGCWAGTEGTRVSKRRKAAIRWDTGGPFRQRWGGVVLTSRSHDTSPHSERLEDVPWSHGPEKVGRAFLPGGGGPGRNARPTSPMPRTYLLQPDNFNERVDQGEACAKMRVRPAGRT